MCRIVAIFIVNTDVWRRSSFFAKTYHGHHFIMDIMVQTIKG